jgi:DNA N-6-adenine-methyltransferase (Dam)
VTTTNGPRSGEQAGLQTPPGEDRHLGGPKPYMARAGREDWRTPPEVIALLRALWGRRPDLDPCAPRDVRHGFASGGYGGPAGTPGDGLAAAWAKEARTVYVNPPFGGLAEWSEKCSSEARQGAEVVLLLPARTDTRYWHESIATAQACCFWRGRMRFVGAPASAPFPTALVYWGHDVAGFRRVFSPFGMVVDLPAAPAERVA